MSNSIIHHRLLDKESIPTEEQILAAIGSPTVELWHQIRTFLNDNYTFEPELHFLGHKYGWCYKYVRKGKTLCVLFPETGAFTVLVTLGKKEIEEFLNNPSTFNEDTQGIFSDARQYHDGKWIYKRILNHSDLQDVKSLVGIKKAPQSQPG